MSKTKLLIRTTSEGLCNAAMDPLNRDHYYRKMLSEKAATVNNCLTRDLDYNLQPRGLHVTPMRIRRPINGYAMAVHVLRPRCYHYSCQFRGAFQTDAIK